MLDSLAPYKLVLSQGAQNYRLYKFGDLSSYSTNNTTSASDLTNVVKDKTILNKHIYDCTFFSGIKIKISNIIDDYTYGEDNEYILQPSYDIEIPVTSPAGTQQYIYFTDRPYKFSVANEFTV